MSWIRPTLFLTSLFVGITLLGIIWVANGVIGTGRWPVRTIQVDGEFQRVTPEQLRAAVAPTLHVGFFAVDLSRVREAAEALPWVQTAAVRKQWPDRIQVRVIEHQPVARWGAEALINSEGEVFSVDRPVSFPELPLLVGPPNRVDAVLSGYRAVYDALARTGLTLREVSLRPRGAWEFQLDGPLTLRVGRDRMIERIKRLADIYAVILKTRSMPPAVIDLRYTNGVAVAYAR